VIVVSKLNTLSAANPYNNNSNNNSNSSSNYLNNNSNRYLIAIISIASTIITRVKFVQLDADHPLQLIIFNPNFGFNY